ncbi:olfactory receptor 6N2-like [Nothobranchius furzeri]|uniref:olfactory receptor 6N2-like n=1 Tax=Nothobranchius furzeri TaxID=105023 RepID=UPI002403CA7A|nr:olfactory receptor 6N2-like [Nothobranchius furzeri]
MDNESNIAYITLSGYVEMNKYRYLYFTVLFIVYVLIICSNSTIVYIIWTDKDLHEPMYIFIAALLFNCVLYSTTVYPKLLIDFLSEKQIISYSACLFQFFTFYSVGATEFLLLAAMAFDRYVSICNPLRYQAIMTKATVTSFLILSWIIPFIHLGAETFWSAKAKLCSFNLKGIFCNNSIFPLQCVKSRLITIMGLVSLVYVVILPILFTIFTYTKILIISFEKGKAFRRKAAETCIPHLLVLIIFSYLAIYGIIIARVESDLSETVQFVMTLQLLVYHPWLNPFIYGLKMKKIYKRLKFSHLTIV